MNYDEQQVFDYLQRRGFEDIEFEPRGRSTPPDFLVDGRIAVEARRLNQHDDATGRPLEHDYHRLHDRLENLASSFGGDGEATWFISYRFRRPLPSWKTLEPQVVAFLKQVLRDRPHERREHAVGDAFSIAVLRASSPLDRAFHIGIISDSNAGGWVVHEVSRNLQPCIIEKTDKVSAIRHLYPEWWLVLVDRIGYGMSEDSRIQFREGVSITHDWDRVVLLHPNDPDSFFEVEDVSRSAQPQLRAGSAQAS